MHGYLNVAAGLVLGMTAGTVGSVVGPGPGDAAAARGAHAKPSLLVGSAGVAPGGTVPIAVRFEIEESWHLYWDGLNTTGLPPTIEWRLPEGWTVGPLRWPTPKRQVLPGEIIDHIYEKELVLVADLHVPAGAAAGATETIGADVEWMICSDVCLIENGSVSATVKVDEEAAEVETEAGRVIRTALARVPRPLPKEEAPVRFRPARDTYVVEAAGARRIAFYPGKRCVPLREPIAQTLANGARLTIAVDAATEKRDRFEGIVEYWPAGTESDRGGPGQSFWIESKPR